jgi:surface antigen
MAAVAMLAGCAGSQGQIYGSGVGVSALLEFFSGTPIDVPGQLRAAAATIEAAETAPVDQPVVWKSDRNAGAVTPLAAGFTDPAGRTCRLLRQELLPAFKREVLACRTQDGTWIVTEPSRDL